MQKKTSRSKDAAIIRKRKLDLEIAEAQAHIWKLRGKAKKLRIMEIKRDIRTRSGKK